MIKLAVPDIGEEELEEIRKVFDSKYLVHGDKVEEFENLVMQFLNVKHVIAVSSGTAALHLALAALNIKACDEIIVPDFTFPATSNVVELLGASTRFVDIKLESFCIDVDKIEKSITDKTKAIIPVHEFGQSADMDKLRSITEKYNLRIVEDAACAFGAEYNGKKVGTIGDIGCFSLHPRKAITTGEGGLIVTGNDLLAEKIRILRNHGISYEGDKPQFVAAGFNYRMTNIQGAIGVVQMRKIKAINEKRLEIVHEYNELLKDIKGIMIPQEKDYGRHVWQSYHILINENIDRNLLIKKLKEKGIETNFGAYSVHMQPYYKQKYNYSDINFKNSIYAYKHGIVLPLYSCLKKADIYKVVDILRLALGD